MSLSTREKPRVEAGDNDNNDSISVGAVTANMLRSDGWPGHSDIK